MPKRRKRNNYEQSAKEFEALGCMLASAFIVPIFTFAKIFISKIPIRDSYEAKKGKFIIDAIGLWLLIGLFVYLGSTHFFSTQLVIFWWIDGGIVTLLLISFLIGMGRRGTFREISYRRNSNKPVSASYDIYSFLRNALGIMDGTAKWYDDEDEADRELVSVLKAMKIDAKYKYRLPNGREADAKVMGVLVEGKLSPNTEEVDRLLTQMEEYTQFGHKLYVVIYGRLSNDAKRRIMDKINTRLLNQVYLVYLNNPKRLRVENT